MNTTKQEYKLTKRDYISAMAFLKARIEQLYKQLAKPTKDLDKWGGLIEELIQYQIKMASLKAEGEELGY